MAEGTPDVSRIIKLIMDNPKIIEEIGEMMHSDEAEERNADTSDKQTQVEKSVVNDVPEENLRSKSRRDLLFALKPYLSEKRRGAIDSMLSVAEVFSMLKR
jgi:hypothetical protein